MLNRCDKIFLKKIKTKNMEKIILSKGNGYHDLTKYPYGGDFKRLKEDVEVEFAKGTVKVCGQIRCVIKDTNQLIITAYGAIKNENKQEIFNKNKHLWDVV